MSADFIITYTPGRGYTLKSVKHEVMGTFDTLMEAEEFIEKVIPSDCGDIEFTIKHERC